MSTLDMYFVCSICNVYISSFLRVRYTYNAFLFIIVSNHQTRRTKHVRPMVLINYTIFVGGQLPPGRIVSEGVSAEPKVPMCLRGCSTVNDCFSSQTEHEPGCNRKGRAQISANHLRLSNSQSAVGQYIYRYSTLDATVLSHCY